MKKTTEQHMDYLAAQLKDRGLRLTHQRLEILRELSNDSGHPSAEDIYSRVVKRIPTISLDTVYRTIATFEESGVVSRVQVLDDRGRFDSNLNVHHHMVCTRCKKIEDFYWPAFDNMSIPSDLGVWGDVASKHVELRGLCKDCRRRAGKK